jgi:hypothetical protein
LYQLYKEEVGCLKPIGDQLRHYITEQGKDTLRAVVLCNPDGKALGVKEILGSSQIIEKLIKMLDEFIHVV